MADERVVEVELGKLRAHPLNSNVMPADRLKALADHIARSGRYPPLIVRPAPEEPGAFQVLDGHHRWRALEQLGHTTAACVVWDADEAEALLLLSTLNRLEGEDDPQRRSALLGRLQARLETTPGELAKLLPESAAQVQKYLDLQSKPPAPAGPPRLDDMPVAVHFFLTGAQRRELERKLAAVGGTREEALMALIRNDQCSSTNDQTEKGRRQKAEGGRE